MKPSLWSRYVFCKLVKLLIFYLAGFYVLYSFIDYSTRMHDFSKNPSLSFFNIGFYYSQVFIKRLDIILPLSFLIAQIKVLLNMNKKRESIALFTSGLKKTTFLTPFFVCACVVAGFLYLCFEYLSPQSLINVESFEKKYFHSSTSTAPSLPQFLRLADEGLIIYSYCDPAQTKYYDVFYMPSATEIWKLESLSLENNFTGKDAEHFMLNEEGEFALVEHKATVTFSPFVIAYDSADLNPLTIECGSFSFLASSLKKISTQDPILSAKIAVQIFYKIAVLFLPFLITMACACFCLVFSRKLPIFMIYAMSIFGMIGYFLLMDAAMILGESLILPGYVALLSPSVLMFVFFLPKFIRCCKN